MANWAERVEQVEQAEPAVRVARAERVARGGAGGAGGYARHDGRCLCQFGHGGCAHPRARRDHRRSREPHSLLRRHCRGRSTTRSQMERWEPWVRAYVAIGEMLQGISFQKTATLRYRIPVLSAASLIAEIGRPQKATFRKQIPLVLSWAELRNERATEIMAQIDPPYAFWSSIIYMHPDRTRRTFELINMVLQFCVYVEMRFKHALACWRPVEYNAQVQPMITTPGHGSFPSGHATQVYAVGSAELKRCVSIRRSGISNGNRAAQSPGGAHRDQPCRCRSPFPGRQHGRAHAGRGAGRVLRRALHTGIRNSWAGSSLPLGSTRLPPPTSIRSADQPAARCCAGPFYSQTAGGDIAPSPLMEYIWGKAQQEWTGRFP